jgi:hypothetical protein
MENDNTASTNEINEKNVETKYVFLEREKNVL